MPKHSTYHAFRFLIQDPREGGALLDIQLKMSTTRHELEGHCLSRQAIYNKDEDSQPFMEPAISSAQKYTRASILIIWILCFWLMFFTTGIAFFPQTLDACRYNLTGQSSLPTTRDAILKAESASSTGLSSFMLQVFQNLTSSSFTGFTRDQMLRGSFSTALYPPRLRLFMNKLAECKKPLTILTLGGSITAGRTKCCGSLPKMAVWPALVELWLNKAFPCDNAGKHTVVNRAKGATGSAFAASNIDNLINGQRFDLVIVETACNDMALIQGGSHMDVRRATEKLIRLLRDRLSDAEILYLELFPGDPLGNGTLRRKRDAELLDNGYASGEDDHRQVLSYYNIPSISLRDSLFPEMHVWRTLPKHEWNLETWLAGRQANSPSKDYVHPNVEGHSRIAQFLVQYLILLVSLGEASLEWADRRRDLLEPPLFISPAEAEELLLQARTRLDFGESPCYDALAPSQEGIKGFENQTSWRWYADSKQKFGWIITEYKNEWLANTISFRFRTGTVGRLTIGYLRSYSPEMGKAETSVDCGADPRVMEGIIINGAWEHTVSLYQEVTVNGLPVDSSCIAHISLLPPVASHDCRNECKFKLLLLAAN